MQSLFLSLMKTIVFNLTVQKFLSFIVEVGFEQNLFRWIMDDERYGL